MVQQKDERRVNGLSGDNVVIVKYQGDVRIDGGNLVDERGHQGFNRRRLRR